MSYSCANHGWMHGQQPCPQCFPPIVTATANERPATQPDPEPARSFPDCNKECKTGWEPLPCKKVSGHLGDCDPYHINPNHSRSQRNAEWQRSLEEATNATVRKPLPHVQQPAMDERGKGRERNQQSDSLSGLRSGAPSDSGTSGIDAADVPDTVGNERPATQPEPIDEFDAQAFVLKFWKAEGQLVLNFDMLTRLVLAATAKSHNRAADLRAELERVKAELAAQRHCDTCGDPVKGSVHVETPMGSHRCFKCMKRMEIPPEFSGPAQQAIPMAELAEARKEQGS